MASLFQAAGPMIVIGAMVLLAASAGFVALRFARVVWRKGQVEVQFADSFAVGSRAGALGFVLLGFLLLLVFAVASQQLLALFS